MAVHKQKKNVRQRAKTTHGWGSMKKHRGAGHRGGRGLSGSGKRSDQRKPALWKDKKYFGKHGFTSKSRMPEMVTINIKTLDDRAETFVKKGTAKFENGAYVIDLADIGYNKLLSTGNATKKLMITTAYATEKAVEKVKKAGGDVKVTAKKTETAKQPEQAGQEEPEQPAE
jgi:large subunit ribosomal protein L15